MRKPLVDGLPCVSSPELEEKYVRSLGCNLFRSSHALELEVSKRYANIGHHLT